MVEEISGGIVRILSHQVLCLLASEVLDSRVSLEVKLDVASLSFVVVKFKTVA